MIHMRPSTKSSSELPANKAAGMTLIEVVLAIAVAGFVLTAATSFVVSISSIWSTRSERHFFEDHVDGVMHFLQGTFDRAGYAIGTDSNNSNNSGSNANSQNGGSGTAPGNNGTPQLTLKTNTGSTNSNRSSGGNASDGVSLIQSSEEPIAWKRPPGFSDFEDELIAFELNQLPPLLNSPEDVPTMGKVQGYLHFDKEHGLRLVWYPLLQEEVEETEDLRSTSISPWLESISYVYWDEDFEEWEVSDTPKENEDGESLLLPRYLQFTFLYNEVRKTRSLAIPIPIKSALLY